MTTRKRTVSSKPIKPVEPVEPVVEEVKPVETVEEKPVEPKKVEPVKKAAPKIKLRALIRYANYAIGEGISVVPDDVIEVEFPVYLRIKMDNPHAFTTEF